MPAAVLLLRVTVLGLLKWLFGAAMVWACCSVRRRGSAISLVWKLSIFSV